MCLQVARIGAGKSVEFAGEPPPKHIRDCIRRVAIAWTFHDPEQPADVELLATLG